MGNAQASGALAHRDAAHRLKLPNRHRLQGASKAFPLRPSALEARDSALLQAFAFELTQGRENCKLEPAARGIQIQTFFQRDEWNVQRLKILQHRQEVFQVSSDSIQRPAHNDLDPRAASIKKKPVKTRPAILRPTHFVGVFGINTPAPRLAVATELKELVFAGLGAVGGAHARVDSRLHGKIRRVALVVWNDLDGHLVLPAQSAIPGWSQEACREKMEQFGRVDLGCPEGDQWVIGLWDGVRVTHIEAPT